MFIDGEEADGMETCDALHHTIPTHTHQIESNQIIPNQPTNQVLEREPELVAALANNARAVHKGLAKISGIKVGRYV